MDIKDIIYIGQTKAIIVQFYNEEKTECEVVYMDHKGMAINEDAALNGEKWEFKIQKPCGGYADNNTRLSPFVQMLKSKKY